MIRPSYDVAIIRPLGMGWCAGGADGGRIEREENRGRRNVILTRRLPSRADRPTDIDRAGRVMLHPLTQIGIRMLVPICISCRQFVMDVLCCSERREHKNQ